MAPVKRLISMRLLVFKQVALLAWIVVATLAILVLTAVVATLLAPVEYYRSREQGRIH
jgi:hypothetical protein